MSKQSYFEQMTGKPVSQVWSLRLFAIMIALALVLAMFVFKDGSKHSFCNGLALGFTIGLIAQTFALSRAELKDSPARSDVDGLTVTR